MKSSKLKLYKRWAAGAVLASMLAVPVAAQQLYVFTSGSLGGFAKAAFQAGASGTVDWCPVGFYVFKHPNGSVIFDTGINDKAIVDGEGWLGPLNKGFGVKLTKDHAIPVQLAKIGLTPKDIRYVVTSHMHFDHAGNISLFPNATHIAQEEEFKAALFPDHPFQAFYMAGDFAGMKQQNTIMLNGDLDVFGDGTFRIMKGTGHTKGSQFAVAKLPKTGTVVLTGDAVYLKENLDKNILPPLSGATNQIEGYKTYQRIRHIRDSENAQIFYAHDPDAYKVTKQAPEFYN
ncbi:N-acyl homoserine lactonase family protein [Rhodoferax sp.]|uniref:N-acyl homoserine lactonase family protein n=1 Tax=Rhodoferax sp. TaxID=50421 RepID=UPI002627D19F|nr:N-acyl homoserine lactonase family protein [Rhodoferax sp.]MDD2919123.1 N-acyl homoserine lactonase family protein [Rhodoferax sp.]